MYPQEIERVIGEVAGVWECAVVGVPDEEFGERAVAFVVPARNRGDAPQPLFAAIEEYVRQHLGRLKRPSEIRFIDALPRSPTGKVLRRALREILKTP
ncbi:MAG TPA: class I adenylate-forming enzyme family protein [Burkholderiaceae bacterium]|nr:class I adenylate-forming enzyme family protein [Burkholderiaceae bacterium]